MAYGSSTLLGEDKKNQKNQINQAINYNCYKNIGYFDE